MDRVLTKLCEHKDQITNIVACVTWNDDSYQVVFNMQKHSNMAYAIALMQAELMSMMTNCE